VIHAPKSRFVHSDVLFGQGDAMRYIGNGVKLGLIYNPRELNVPPKAWCRLLGDVVYESENQKGAILQPTKSQGQLRRASNVCSERAEERLEP
jgi:hypothetical protein